MWITYCTIVTNVNRWCCPNDWVLNYQHYMIMVILKPMFFWYFWQESFLDCFFLLVTILIMAMFIFQFWVSIKIGSWYYLTFYTSLLFSHFLMCCLTNQAALEYLFLYVELNAASRCNFVTFVILWNYMSFN